MLKLLKSFIMLVSTFVAFIIILSFIASVTIFSNCGYGNEILNYARNLPDEQLAQMYSIVEKKHGKFMENYSKQTAYKPDRPTEIAGVPIKSLNIDHTWVVLAGCFDDKVLLKFQGIKGLVFQKRKKQIILSWGEHDQAGSEVIWEQ